MVEPELEAPELDVDAVEVPPEDELEAPPEEELDDEDELDAPDDDAADDEDDVTVEVYVSRHSRPDSQGRVGSQYSPERPRWQTEPPSPVPMQASCPASAPQQSAMEVQGWPAAWQPSAGGVPSVQKPAWQVASLQQSALAVQGSPRSWQAPASRSQLTRQCWVESQLRPEQHATPFAHESP